MGLLERDSGQGGAYKVVDGARIRFTLRVSEAFGSGKCQGLDRLLDANWVERCSRCSQLGIRSATNCALEVHFRDCLGSVQTSLNAYVKYR